MEVRSFVVYTVYKAFLPRSAMIIWKATVVNGYQYPTSSGLKMLRNAIVSLSQRLKTPKHACKIIFVVFTSRHLKALCRIISTMNNLHHSLYNTDAHNNKTKYNTRHCCSGLPAPLAQLDIAKRG